MNEESNKDMNTLLGSLTSLKVPIDEKEISRLIALDNTDLLDSNENEHEFDKYTSLAKRIFKVPIALISLVGLDRQWFKSRVGLEVCQTHRDHAFCSYTVLNDSPDVFVVTNALEDDRFKTNPLVTGSPYIRFYAGGAIYSEGYKIGTLCIIDTEPRDMFSLDEKASLLDIANMLSTIIDNRRRNAMNNQSNKSKMLVEMMHNLRTPLTSINLACEQLKTNVYAGTTTTTSCEREVSDENSTDMVIEELSHEISKLKLIVETSLSMGNMSFERDQKNMFFQHSMTNSKDSSNCIYSSISSDHACKDEDSSNVESMGTKCNMLNVINNAMSVIRDVEKDVAVHFDIDRQSFQGSNHIGYPNCLLFVILSTVSNALIKGSKIAISIKFEEAKSAVHTHSCSSSCMKSGFTRIQFTTTMDTMETTNQYPVEDIFSISFDGMEQILKDLNGSISKCDSSHNGSMSAVVIASIPCTIITKRPRDPDDLDQEDKSCDAHDAIGRHGANSKTSAVASTYAIVELKDHANLATGREVAEKATCALTVLLVEDTIAVQKLIKRQLERLNCVVICADNGKQALEHLQANATFDLIIFDFLMPVITGPDMMKRINELHLVNVKTTSPTTVIVGMSATANYEEQTQLYEYGMHAFFGKPLKSTTLNNIITSINDERTLEGKNVESAIRRVKELCSS